ncbi:MAG: 2-C-methyl-D-erythritol 4-phosphate cytidylyltransferase, partial [Termitinemataceae bacterium]
MGASIAAVITAAGVSRRMGGTKKEYRNLGEGFVDEEGNPLSVLGASVLAFSSCPEIEYLVITVPADPVNGEMAARSALPASVSRKDFRPKVIFVPGSVTRRGSVHNALKLLAAYPVDYTLIHDGARPWLAPDLIHDLIAADWRRR